MRALRVSVLTLGIAAVVLWSTVALGLVSVADRGNWPGDWPKELEPLRERSKTIGVATGLQQNIYQIPFDDQADFEKLWPVLLQLKSKGGTLTLYRVGTETADGWPGASNEKPYVRIYAPTNGHVGGPETPDMRSLQRAEELVGEGRALRAGPPWPKDLYDQQGNLPEYVTSEQTDGGKMKWVPASLGGPRLGFINRARIDLQLVVDGEVIDLNRIPLPPGTPIIDRRWDKPGK
jgi:hypothetical protein